MTPTTFILDVDGVMTDGSFLYGTEGKFAKRFSADDHDGLSLLKRHMEILFVTGDHRGFPISAKRIAEDMKMPLHLVSTVDRLSWIGERYDPQVVVYMGDGIFDPYVFQGVGYSIAVADSLEETRQRATFVTSRRGGDRAVAEAALHLLSTFFEPLDFSRPLPNAKFSGQWGVGPDAAQGPVGPDAAQGPVGPDATEGSACADIPASPAKSSMLAPADLAQTYIQAFSNHDLAALDLMFADDVSLIDWDGEHHGRAEVLVTNQGIFEAVPGIWADIVHCHPADQTVVLELLVHVDSETVLKVVDVLTFNAAGQIASVRAYKG